MLLFWNIYNALKIKCFLSFILVHTLNWTTLKRSEDVVDLVFELVFQQLISLIDNKHFYAPTTKSIAPYHFKNAIWGSRYNLLPKIQFSDVSTKIIATSTYMTPNIHVLSES